MRLDSLNFIVGAGIMRIDRRVGRLGLALLAWGCIGLSLSPGLAQTVAPPPSEDPEATLLTELVVTARLPGPAWWTVEKAGARLYILGLPAGPVPANLAWDTTVFTRRLKEANAFLPPPEARVGVNVGLFQGLGLLAHMAPGMGWTNGDVEKGMPAPLAERFAADRKALGYPVARYATPAPAFAAFKLQHDYLEKAGLGEDLGPRLTREARRSGVTVERPVRVDAAPLRLEEISLDRPPICDCFQALLGEVETDPQLYRTAAASWAAGRLDGALAGPRDPFGLCENRLYSGAFSHKLFQAETDALAAHLERPGVTVAVLGIRTLLAEDGIIVRLRARGYVVKGPDADDRH